MELAFQIFIVVGCALLIVAQILRYIDERKMGKWIKINKEARKIVIFFTEREKAVEMRDKIKFFAKFYSSHVLVIDDVLLFDDDSSIELLPYSCAIPAGAQVVYYPKALKKTAKREGIQSDETNYFY